MSPPHDEDRSLAERAAHDLLNPVSAILGLGETLSARGAGLDDATLRAFGESITRQAARLERAIRDLASAALLQRDDPPVAAADTSLPDALSGMASERVRVDIPEGLTVRVDPDMLTSAVGRLIDNAMQFSSEEVVLRAGRDGGSTWIEVADRGTGFAPENLGAAFEPLAAGANARNERGPGLGLGLYIARRLVEVNGGRLTAAGSPGKGTVFRIELPG